MENTTQTAQSQTITLKPHQVEAVKGYSKRIVEFSGITDIIETQTAIFRAIDALVNPCSRVDEATQNDLMAVVHLCNIGVQLSLYDVLAELEQPLEQLK